MRAATGLGLLCLFLCACGYVGPIVPPSPRIPNAVTDLKVIENGSDLIITFTTPSRTLDNLAISRFSTVELRIGTDTQTADVNRWAESAKEFDLPSPPPNEKDVARAAAISYTVPAAEWSGRRIAVVVRTAVKNDKSYSNWSNIQLLAVVPPLAAPVLTVIPTPQGYKLTWSDEGTGVSYQVFRQGTADQPPAQIGTSQRPEYIDTASLYDTPYIYSVVAAKGAAQSPVSNKVPVEYPDKFPPAAPTGLTGIATGGSIELSWQRSPEPDLQGYFVYRSANGAPFERLGGITNLPAYTDLKLQHGVNYRYQVSAIDRATNESDKSATVEVAFP